MANQIPQVIIHDASVKQWLQYSDPIQIFEIYDISGIIPALEEIEKQVDLHQRHAVGFLSYETASAFDSVLKTKRLSDFPLLWFGIFKQPQVYKLPKTGTQSSQDMQWTPDSDSPAYYKDIATIKDFIRQGWTYQVNYTFRLHAQSQVDPYDLFLQLAKSRQANYGAYIDTGHYSICSASPELFFELNGDKLTSKPMKGTAPRGKTLAEDEMIQKQLQQSEKDQAENIMIVDMIRNDFSHVCKYGSVKVPELFSVEKYPTVWQMISRVTGKTDAGLAKILSALFPCASITGAPKVKTMSIINDLEKSPRKIYTGTIGFMQPGRKAQFSVAIRTMIVDKKKDELEYGVGSGVVWDSSAEQEYRECLLKSKVLNNSVPDFELLETMRVDIEKSIFLLDYHLDRLQHSASYFDFQFNRDIIIDQLKKILDDLNDVPCVLRILLDETGFVKIEKKALSLSDNVQNLKIQLAKSTVNREDVFLYHKTTHRQIYEQSKEECPDCDDVILRNENNEITESTIANIVIKEKGTFYTPPIMCGLLSGTYRQWLIDQGKLKERIITIDQLKNCHEIYLINSVREWQPAILIEK